MSRSKHLQSAQSSAHHRHLFHQAFRILVIITPVAPVIGIRSRCVYFRNTVRLSAGTFGSTAETHHRITPYYIGVIVYFLHFYLFFY